MIKNITGTGGITVAGSYPSYPYINMNNVSAGMVRYNGNSQNFEIYDGSTWMTLSSGAATVSLDYEVQNILNWAKAKMAEEQRLNELADKHPTVADALNAVARAEEQVRIAAALVDTA